MTQTRKVDVKESEDNMAQFDVSISGPPFAFNPSSVTIKRGDTVKWTNKTTATHTATGDNGEFDSGDILPNVGTFTHTFPTSGSVPYHCNIHPRMKGTVVVT